MLLNEPQIIHAIVAVHHLTEYYDISRHNPTWAPLAKVELPPEDESILRGQVLPALLGALNRNPSYDTATSATHTQLLLKAITILLDEMSGSLNHNTHAVFASLVKELSGDEYIPTNSSHDRRINAPQQENSTTLSSYDTVLSAEEILLVIVGIAHLVNRSVNESDDDAFYDGNDEFIIRCFISEELFQSLASGSCRCADLTKGSIMLTWILSSFLANHSATLPDRSFATAMGLFERLQGNDIRSWQERNSPAADPAREEQAEQEKLTTFRTMLANWNSQRK